MGNFAENLNKGKRVLLPLNRNNALAAESRQCTAAHTAALCYMRPTNIPGQSEESECEDSNILVLPN